MRPQYRKTISTLLCGLILMGQSAAWFHVATCDGHHGEKGILTSGVGSPSPGEVGHSHCCAHHHAHCDASGPSRQTGSDGGEEQQPAGQSSHDHDSDRCAVCQSLYSAGGVVASERPTASENLVVYGSWFGELPSVVNRCTHLPPLRGPPIV